MKPRLILLGDMGCGKSSLIRTCLGEAAAKAGGFVTLRRREGESLLGFDLAPGRALVDAAAPREAFLDFSRETAQRPEVFATLGVALLQQAKDYPFCLADEFGGLELENDDFYRELTGFLSGNQPCIGVLKNHVARDALVRRLKPGAAYPHRYQELRSYLEADENTLLLPVTGWADQQAQRILAQWADTYARKKEKMRVGTV